MELDKYFMELARQVAKESEEPSTQVGCVIVDSNNNVVSTGCNNYAIDRTSKYSTDEKPIRYLISVHAEMRALIAAKMSIEGCRIYVTHASCENCLKHLIVAGIKEIIYEHLYTNTGFISEEGKDAIIRMMKATNIINRNMQGISYIEDSENQN
jgi:dCMP deaminase